MKLWWRFRNNSTLWAHFMHAKYCSKAYPVDTTQTSASSGIWKRMLKAREDTEPHIKWIIGKGDIDTCKDRWLKSHINQLSPSSPVKIFFNQDGSPNRDTISTMLGQ